MEHQLSIKYGMFDVSMWRELFIRGHTKLYLLAPELEGDPKPCPICLEPMDSDQYIRGLFCHHFFHEKCIVNWLGNNGTCPCCRAIFYEKPVKPNQICTWNHSAKDASANLQQFIYNPFFPRCATASEYGYPQRVVISGPYDSHPCNFVILGANSEHTFPIDFVTGALPPERIGFPDPSEPGWIDEFEAIGYWDTDDPNRLFSFLGDNGYNLYVYQPLFETF